MNEQPNIQKIEWPGKRAAFLRLLVIAAILFPISWAINAFLIKSWRVTIGNQESARHFAEWMITLVVAIAIVFWASLSPRFSWFFNWRMARRFFIPAAWVLTIYALFCAEENFRGQRTWNNYRTQLEAKGEVLDFRAFIPKAVPDEENFAATPFIQSWFKQTTNTTTGGLTYSFQWNDPFSQAYQMVGNSELHIKTNKAERIFTDLVSWRMALDAMKNGEINSQKEFRAEKRDRKSREEAAAIVLDGLKSGAANLEELRLASKRPRSVYPVVYMMDNPWGILLPHLAQVKGVCQRLNVEASAELAAGQSEKALDDIKLMLYMADSVREEPTLVSYLVRLASANLATQPVWEGLAEHRFSDAQLQEVQTLFQKYNFIGELKPPLDGERAMGVLTPDLLEKKGLGLLVNLMGPEQPGPMDRDVADFFGHIIPSGWFKLETVNYLQLFQNQLEGTYDAVKKTVSPTRIAANEKNLQREIGGGRLGKNFGSLFHHRIIAALMLPSLNKLPFKAAISQVTADELVLACALERFHLATGEFPDRLDMLAPKFISEMPLDVFTGEPYKYHRTDDGQFVLYSVGQDEKDDGGISGKKLFDTTGDWVWQYPAN